jgi:hypothetical protein
MRAVNLEAPSDLHIPNHSRAFQQPDSGGLPHETISTDKSRVKNIVRFGQEDSLSSDEGIGRGLVIQHAAFSTTHEHIDYKQHIQPFIHSAAFQHNRQNVNPL